MAKIEWDSSLSIGVDVIDEQHKMLVKRLGDLARAVELNKGEMEIVKTLDFMYDYTSFHFSSEEKHMAEAEYPGLEFQKKQHEEFTKTLQKIVDEYREEGPTRVVVESVNIFLMNWLVNHIKGVDLEFAKYLHDKGIVLHGE